MTRPASPAGATFVRLDPGVKAAMVDAASRLGMSLADYLTDLFQRRDGKLVRRRLEVDVEDGRGRKKVRAR